MGCNSFITFSKFLCIFINSSFAHFMGSIQATIRSIKGDCSETQSDNDKCTSVNLSQILKCPNLQMSKMPPILSILINQAPERL
jgi:hypothetical protein